MTSSNEINIYLAPSPGAKPEFLARIQPIDAPPSALDLWNELKRSVDNDIIVLEDYTRDSWSWKPNIAEFKTLRVVSTDGRNKLPGFVKYLKDRQKSAYGRISPSHLFVVSYIQSKQDDPNRIDCRICSDLTKIPNITIKPKNPKPIQPQHRAPTNTNDNNKQKLPQQSTNAKTNASTNTNEGAAAPPKKGGILGKLVGAQQRTNVAVAVATAKPRQQQPQQPPQTKIEQQSASLSQHVPQTNVNDHDDEGPDDRDSSSRPKTAQEVFAEFRQFCQEMMLDFDMDENEEIMKIPINLPEYTVDLISDEEKSKVTMEILKYMVYEAAEEVNEEWVAVKEPSEFMDEMTIVIYKEGAAPPEVLEELNKGELPDEIVGQQRELANQRQRAAELANQKRKRVTEQQAHMNKRSYGANEANDDDDDEEFAALNRAKRDRRTVEDFERERQQQRR